MMKTNYMQEISDMIGDNQFGLFKVKCIDCGHNFEIMIERTGEDTLMIIGGAMAKNPRSDWMFKCSRCFKTEPLFIGENEVYSRIVGYLRPIKMWNNAKLEEYKLRKEYQMPKASQEEINE